MRKTYGVVFFFNRNRRKRRIAWVKTTNKGVGSFGSRVVTKEPLIHPERTNVKKIAEIIK